MSKKTQADIYKIRYQIYRDLGYSSTEARKLRSRALDVSDIKLDDNRDVVKKNNYKSKLRTTTVTNYKKDMDQVTNDTTYTRWGMYTQDARYKDKTMRSVKALRKELKINNKQALYFLYIMNEYGYTFDKTKQELMSNKEFEMYAKSNNSRRRRK